MSYEIEILDPDGVTVRILIDKRLEEWELIKKSLQMSSYNRITELFIQELDTAINRLRGKMEGSDS